ncbi:substrate-binding domain-containing protein [Galbitalea soli]|uniref:Sugar ABC transporter substrate-binding protein n=1 Tax=Galbitalea soli TaxID=1268042 RepID=A0A7C9TRY2_9MICO|nr:substrate-binding domain-containing protein [Galbitalea soli]NEM92557.1 sugar ABC transporter substrate-binding protein [Galbitalea soli]NYJ29594.1 ribose transport system substrate-binding protein [Galbitalea soli]
MMLRRSAVIVAVAAAGLLLAGCSGPGASTGSGGASGGASALPANCKSDKPTLAVSLPNTVNPYYVAMRQSFIDNGAKAGFTVKVAIANDSDSSQLAQVQSFIQQNVCVVALNPVTSGPGAAEVNLLTKAHIPVFTVNIDADRDQVKSGGGSIVEYVGADQKEGGKVMADAALEDLGSKPAVVGIAGEPNETVTVDRDKAFEAEITAKSSTSKVVASVDTKVDPQVSLQVVTEMLQGHPEINTVFADTGPAAVGSIQAIKQLGLSGKVTLYAFCAANTKLDSVLYRGCAAQQPSLYAQIVADNAAKFIKGETVPEMVFQPVKVFTEGQQPAEDELG